MGYLKDTYCLFKDMVSETENVNTTLLKLYMKMCIKQYHALIPQLDLIATQWGISIKDKLAHNDFGLPKSERKSQERKKEQLQNKAEKPSGRMVEEETENTDHVQPLQQPFMKVDAPVARPSTGRRQKKVKTSGTNSAETLGIFRGSSKGAMTKAPGNSATSSQNSEVRLSPSSTLTRATTTASNIDVQLLQLLRKAPVFQDQDMVKEYYRMKESNGSQFTGLRVNYHVWRQQFIALVHSQQRLTSDKGKVLSTAIDKRKRSMGNRIRVLNYDSQTYTFLIAEMRRLYRETKQKIITTALDLFEGSKVQLSSLESVRALREKLEAYKTTMETYRIEEEEFAPNGELYRAIKDKKFTQPDIRR
jgi:hypothetical protein